MLSIEHYFGKLLHLLKHISTMKFIIAFSLALIGFSSFSQKTTEKIITLAPYLSFQNYEHFKRLTLSSPDSRIEYLQGFDFSWGYVYKLSVIETELQEQLSDGTQFKYAYQKTLSKTKVPDSTTFRLLIDPNRYYYELDASEQHMNETLKQLNDSTFLYFDQVEIEVPEPFIRKFETILKLKESMYPLFIVVGDKRIRLVGF